MAMELVRQEQGMFNILDSVDVGQIKQTMSSIVKFQTVVQSTLKQGHDYDTIPGTQKPTLLKPGAEKILMLMGLTSEYEIVEKVEDYEKEVFAYTIRCILSKGDYKIAEGLGSCNSKEDKYRWRWVKEEDIPLGEDKDMLKSRTTKWGSTQYRIENDEICSQANTILKMAKKRAQIDATLTVAALSEVFTQDIEDMAEFQHKETVENMTLERAKGMKVNFGTHKGRTIGEIAAEDMGYVEWLAKNAYDDVVKKAADMILNGEPTKQEKSKAQKPKQDKKEAPKEQVAFDFDDSELPF